MSDSDEIKELSKEIAKAFKAVEFLSLGLAGVAATALAVVFSIIAYHWVIAHWQASLITALCLGGAIAHAFYKWDGK